MMTMTKKKKIIIISTAAALAVIMAVTLTLLLVFKPWKDKNYDFDDTPVLKETDIDLVKSGKTDYKVVIPEGYDTNMSSFALSELKLFFAEATGISLTVVDDSEVTAADDKYISLGHTAQFEEKGYENGYDTLGRSGFIVKRDGGKIFIAGASDYGTTFGVYEFLHHQFNYEYYYKDTYSLDKNVRNDKLLDFDLTVTASIDQTYLAMGEVIEDETHAHRLKTYTQEDVYMQIGNSRWHTSFAIIGAMTDEEKALWVSPAGTQPCFSRDREGLSTRMAHTITEALKLDRVVTAVNIGQQDNSSWCTCSECAAELAKYGTNSATFIKTVNMVADKVQAFIDEEQPGREFSVTFFAYLATIEPPVKENADGSFSPIDEEVRLRKNVSVLNAPIALNAYMHYDINQSVNSGSNLSTRKWAAMGDNMYMWIYNNTFYGNYFTPADSFGGTQGTLKFLSENGTRWIMQQGQQNNTVSPDWSRLKAYIDAKLAWNVDANRSKLIKNFIAQYFGAAAPAMQSYFDNYQTWYAYIAEQYDYVEHRTMQPEFFPRNVINTWLSYIDEAYAAIEPLKATDADLYDTLYSRILLESLSPRYLQMAIFRTDFSIAEQSEKENQFREDCSVLGVSMLSEKFYIEGNALFS